MSNPQVAAIFNKLRAKLAPVLEQLPAIIGNEGVNYSLEAFDKQGWEGIAWPKRKNKKDVGRAIMVKSGRTKRSVKVIRTTPNSVRWGSVGVPYAKRHNDGELVTRAAQSETFVRNRFKRGTKKGAFQRGTTPGKGFEFKAYSYNMPRRQFIGDTPALRKRLNAVAKREIKQALKSR